MVYGGDHFDQRGQTFRPQALFQQIVWCSVGPANRQRHPPRRTGLALTDEDPLMHRAAPLEHDRQALAEQRVERMSDPKRVQRFTSVRRMGLMTGSLGEQASQERLPGLL